MTNTPTVSLNNKSGAICDGILFEESEVISSSSSPSLVPKVAHDKVDVYRFEIYSVHWLLKSPSDVPQNSKFGETTSIQHGLEGLIPLGLFEHSFSFFRHASQ